MRLEDLPDEQCAWCGAGFETNRTYQKYCCKDCRIAAYIARQVEDYRAAARRDNAGCTCPVCGAIFDATHGRQKYCCRDCRVMAQTDRRRGRTQAEALTALRCARCGGPMPGAVITSTKYCRPCKAIVRKAQHREINRRFKLRHRERINAEARRRYAALRR